MAHLHRHACLGEAPRIAWHFIAPGKPMRNGICEAITGELSSMV
jgi:hypothetical protein